MENPVLCKFEGLRVRAVDRNDPTKESIHPMGCSKGTHAVGFARNPKGTLVPLCQQCREGFAKDLPFLSVEEGAENFAIQLSQKALRMEDNAEALRESAKATERWMKENGIVDPLNQYRK